MFMGYFVLLNIFLAIINESYDFVYKHRKAVKRDELLIILLLISKSLLFFVYNLPKNVVTCKYFRKNKANRKARLPKKKSKIPKDLIDKYNYDNEGEPEEEEKEDTGEPGLAENDEESKTPIN
jgi:hypothetical protein